MGPKDPIVVVQVEKYPNLIGILRQTQMMLSFAQELSGQKCFCIKDAIKIN